MILNILFCLLLNPAQAKGFDHSHTLFTQVLKEHIVVKNKHVTEVNYKKLKANNIKLTKYLTILSKIPQKTYNSWNEKEKMSFLINAYNAFTLKLIIDNYPIKSIKKIGSFFASPWKKEFFQLLGKKRYLDWIEHEVLRKKFSEPRIHFAVNCASIGCPQLRPKAFIASKLDKQLEEQTYAFLQDKSRNYIKNKTVYVSKIFDWFEEDFTKGSSTVLSFVAKYMTKDKNLIKNLSSGKYKLKYTDYDWSLNKVQ